MTENVFFAHLKDIVKTAYGDGDVPDRDWHTAIDMYVKASGITEGMSEGRIAQQRSDFLQYVQGKKFDRDGEQI